MWVVGAVMMTVMFFGMYTGKGFMHNHGEAKDAQHQVVKDEQHHPHQHEPPIEHQHSEESKSGD